MKHTPGPWHVEACPEHGGKHPLHDNRYVRASNGDYVCAMRDTSAQFYDARLIAAAPELLEAASNLYELLANGFHIDNEWPDHAARTFELARAAIAHATGGE